MYSLSLRIFLKHSPTFLELKKLYFLRVSVASEGSHIPFHAPAGALHFALQRFAFNKVEIHKIEVSRFKNDIESSKVDSNDAINANEQKEI